MEVALQRQVNITIIAVLCLAALLCAILCPTALAANRISGQSTSTICRIQAASYFGGSGNEQGWPTTASTIDADGNILFAIVTASPNLAAGGYDMTHNGAADILIVRMNSDLTQVLSATYLGGSANETPDAISIGDGGRVYVSGSTASANFPTTPGAYDITTNGAEDAFVAILSADLDSLLASTFIGGNGSDMECATVVSTDGSIFAAFRTESTDLPTSPGAVKNSLSPGGADYYLVRLNGSLTTALASTYFGGNGYEFRPKPAIDRDGDIYCTGSTFSSDLPVSPGAYDTQNNDGSIDAYIFHINKTMDAILASTYVGGNNTDWSYAIVLGDNDDVYISGHVDANWPTTPGCFDSTYGGGTENGSDTYLSRLSSDLTTLKASSYLGGSGWDWGVDLARDSQGNVYLTGETSSSDFPTTRGATDSTCCGAIEIFLAKFDSTMQTLHLSTFIGGSGNDRWPGVIAARDNFVYLIGYTESAGLHTTAGAFDASYNGNGDMFAIKYSVDQYTCGDANSDRSINISDAVYLIAYIFSGGLAPDPLSSGDANCDSAVNISDAVYLIAYIFSGGSAPCAGCP
jgi:hypothetical protein